MSYLARVAAAGVRTSAIASPPFAAPPIMPGGALATVLPPFALAEAMGSLSPDVLAEPSPDPVVTDLAPPAAATVPSGPSRTGSFRAPPAPPAPAGAVSPLPPASTGDDLPTRRPAAAGLAAPGIPSAPSGVPPGPTAAPAGSGMPESSFPDQPLVAPRPPAPPAPRAADPGPESRTPTPGTPKASFAPTVAAHPYPAPDLPAPSSPAVLPPEPLPPAAPAAGHPDALIEPGIPSRPPVAASGAGKSPIPGIFAAPATVIRAPKGLRPAWAPMPAAPPFAQPTVPAAGAAAHRPEAPGAPEPRPAAAAGDAPPGAAPPAARAEKADAHLGRQDEAAHPVTSATRHARPEDLPDRSAGARPRLEGRDGGQRPADAHHALATTPPARGQAAATRPAEPIARPHPVPVPAIAPAPAPPGVAAPSRRDARVTIGQIDVQVVNAPPPMPAPRPSTTPAPAPVADALERHGLDRFRFRL